MTPRTTISAVLVSLALGCARPADPPKPHVLAAPPPSAVSASVPLAPASVTAAVAAPSAAAVPALPWRLGVPSSGKFGVVDLHVDTPYQVHFKGRAVASPSGQAMPAMLVEGGYAGVVYPIYVPDYAEDNNPSIALAESIFATLESIVAAQPLLVMARDGEVPAGKVAVFPSIEGAGAFAADIEKIDGFIARGVKLVGPVHANDNRLATSATGKGRFGLTELGKRFCERVYDKGGLVDLSHMSDRAIADLLPIAARFSAPLVATHSNARKLRGASRNLTDEQLRAIAKSGGVAGLNLHSSFVGRGKVRMRDVVKMVRHLIKVAGIDHVAIGTDYDGGNPPSSLHDASKMQDLARELLAAGMSDADVRKIFGQNALRVLYWQRP